jgi:hypothetical protein
MIRIAISVEAFEAIARSLPVGSAGFWSLTSRAAEAKALNGHRRADRGAGNRQQGQKTDSYDA